MTGYELKPFPKSSHDTILRLIKPGTRVADIGCAGGFLASQIIKKDCVVTGIDIDSIALKKAKRYCARTLSLDISKHNIPGRYDIIILGDVLEHLPRPEKVLYELKDNLNPGGYLIVSVPNIANIYARLKIFFGNFDYAEKGIFDKTHLRFFTLKSIKMLYNTTGYRIAHLTPTPIPLHLTIDNRWHRVIAPAYSLLYWLARVRPQLFAYQFVAVLKPGGEYQKL